jgi:hypothetical protein
LANNCPIPHKCIFIFILKKQKISNLLFFLLASNWPFFFKLTFSATPITDDDAQLGEEMDTSLATITIGNGGGGGGNGRRHHGQKSPDDDNRNESSNEHRRRRHSSPTT